MVARLAFFFLPKVFLVSRHERHKLPTTSLPESHYKSQASRETRRDGSFAVTLATEVTAVHAASNRRSGSDQYLQTRAPRESRDNGGLHWESYPLTIIVSEGPTHPQLLREKEPARWITPKLQPQGPPRAAASMEGPGRTGQPQRRGRRHDERRRRGPRVGVARIAAVSLLGGAELGAEGVERRLGRGP